MDSVLKLVQVRNLSTNVDDVCFMEFDGTVFLMHSCSVCTMHKLPWCIRYSRVIAQLSTYHIGLFTAHSITTHSAPLSIKIDLNVTFRN